MDSAEQQRSASDVVKAGDHIQIFSGKHDPDTGARRELMVIWRNNKPIWSGPVDKKIWSRTDVFLRQIDIQLPIKLHHAFKVDQNPLTTS